MKSNCWAAVRRFWDIHRRRKRRKGKRGKSRK